MTNREKLNIIYERMWWYTNPRKDDKTWWTTYDQNPVLIGNVLQFMKDLDWDCIPNRIYILWEKLTLPIDEQSDECIDFVYALTKE